MLEVKNLHKSFGGVRAVNDCSFSVKRGKITALIGPNGSGKSTIFNLVSGVLVPDSGSIIFDGENISGLQVEKISNLGISRVFQQSRLFGNLSIMDNVILALGGEDTKFWLNLVGLNNSKKEFEKKATDALKLVGMESKSNSIGKELSFGQKRLVELARAIVKPHKLLLLDEPVAGVTPQMRKKIAGILLNLKKKKETILLIEHDMNFTLGIADEVIVLDEGRVIARGTPAQIKKNKKVLEAYLGD
jgi:ABC-type branched-subunit amino acid transport system ATPase component